MPLQLCASQPTITLPACPGNIHENDAASIPSSPFPHRCEHQPSAIPRRPRLASALGLGRAACGTLMPYSPLARAPCLQPRTFDSDGKNQATVDHVKRGQMHAQCLLDELGLGSFDEWISRIAGLSTGEPLRLAINPVLVRLVEKVDGDGTFALPDGSQGDGTIRRDRPKFIFMAIQRAIDAARKPTTGEGLPWGYSSTFTTLADATRKLEKRDADAAREAGNEHRQRRDRELFDDEQLRLFESILGNKVAEDQRSRGETPRHPFDTLTLGVTVALYFAMGQRGLNMRVIASCSGHSVAEGRRLIADPQRTRHANGAPLFSHCFVVLTAVERFAVGLPRDDVLQLSRDVAQH